MKTTEIFMNRCLPLSFGATTVAGQTVTASAYRMELKTRTETVKVRFSSKTKFEHDKKPVDKSHVRLCRREQAAHQRKR